MEFFHMSWWSYHPETLGEDLAPEHLAPVLGARGTVRINLSGDVALSYKHRLKDDKEEIRFLNERSERGHLILVQKGFRWPLLSRYVYLLMSLKADSDSLASVTLLLLRMVTDISLSEGACRLNKQIEREGACGESYSEPFLRKGCDELDRYDGMTAAMLLVGMNNRDAVSDEQRQAHRYILKKLIADKSALSIKSHGFNLAFFAIANTHNLSMVEHVLDQSFARPAGLDINERCPLTPLEIACLRVPSDTTTNIIRKLLLLGASVSIGDPLRFAARAHGAEVFTLLADALDPDTIAKLNEPDGAISIPCVALAYDNMTFLKWWWELRETVLGNKSLSGSKNVLELVKGVCGSSVTYEQCFDTSTSGLKRRLQTFVNRLP